MESESTAFQSGCEDAGRDIVAGRMRYFWQTRNPWATFAHELLQNRFQIEVESTSCFVTDDLTRYREGYNATIAAHVDQVFGPGALAKALDEIQQFRQRQYDDYFKREPPSR